MTPLSSTTPVPAISRAKALHRTSQRAEPFTLGRVSFEILTDERSGPPGISEDLHARVYPGRAPHAEAHVVCSVKSDPWLRSDESKPLVWNDDRAEIVCGGVRGVVTRLSPGIYVASCRIAAGVQDVGPLLLALSAAVLTGEPAAP